MLSYAVKRLVRSWKLFAALILGMMLAAMFFGGVNVGADSMGKQALDEQLQNTPVDMRLSSGNTYSYCYNGGCSFSLSPPSTATVSNLLGAVNSIQGVSRTEIIGRAQYNAPQFNASSPSIWGLGSSSALYSHMIITGAPPFLPNQTLVESGSVMASNLRIGSIVKYNVSSFYNSYRNITYNLALRVVGFATFDNTVWNSLGASYYSPTGIGGGLPRNYYGPRQDNFIVGWDETFSRLLDWEHGVTQIPPQAPNGTIVTYNSWNIGVFANVYLDRTNLISPFDLETSASRISQVEARVTNTGQQYSFNSNDYLLNPIQNLAPTLASLRFAFILVSIPVFFMSWYVGRTVSHSSFNLRRREIGLLMTKGFSRIQLFRHFLTEALLVGIVAGVIGLFVVILLNPYFVQALGGSLPSTLYFNETTAIITVVFTVILTFLAILGPARQASNLDPARSLRQYLFTEDTKATRQRGAWIAFGLGLYKIILLSLGVNYQTLSANQFSAGFAFVFIFIILIVLDLLLTFIGPFLFLYGAAMLSRGLAFRFHRLFTKVSQRIVGDVASLASKSVFRNPRRAASLVFLVALIVGYSLWVIGDIASMQDYNYRQPLVRVGSDLRVSNIGNNATKIMQQLSTWNNVSAVTPESNAMIYISGLGENIQVRAIDPNTWRQAAYYEDGWFSTPPDVLFRQFQTRDHAIILDRGVASYLGIQFGANLTLNNGRNSTSLRIIGFFGPDYSHLQPPGYFGIYGKSFNPLGWSYMPLSVLNENRTFFQNVSNSTLVKASAGTDLQKLSDSIRSHFPSTSVDIAQNPSQGPGYVITEGVLNVLRLGTVFAAAAACIGIGAVTYTGFKEREKETTMISVRGLSYRNLLGLLLTEVVPLVTFGLILAIIVGLIAIRGDAMAASGTSFGIDYNSLLAPRRVVFPAWSQLQIGVVIGLALAGVFAPALAAARKNLSKMSRTIRFA